MALMASTAFADDGIQTNAIDLGGGGFGLDDDNTPEPTDPPTSAPESSGSGDPHFKTWTGKKFDYHGECDLVLLDHPEFDNGLGMRVHIRTTRINYFSYIEQIALQIGDDVLEFNNDVENVLLNGSVAAPKDGKRKMFLADKYEIIRFKKAVLVKIDRENDGKIEFHARPKVGFPSIKLRAGKSDVFNGSLGLLGDFSTGKQLARDGSTEMNDEDATEYALEWQVRDTEPMLFTDARAPQFPTTCTPPKKMMGNRLGMSHMKEEATKACAAWGEDIDDCIFDVMATRDMASAEEIATLEE
jgi:hypothetical protein